MIISKTPVRMSFSGGGSDLPSFYRKFKGAVLSTTINKFIYVTLNKKFDDGIRVSYSKTEEVESLEDISHPIVKAGLKHLNIEGGIEITTIADVPSKGTGLGSSSSFTVGLINVLNAFEGKYTDPEYLAKVACLIEIDQCGEPIGKQDQYAAAFGNFNLIEFNTDETVCVSPLILSESTLEILKKRLLLFYTGITRESSNILKVQSQEVGQDETKINNLKQMVDLTYSLRDELQNDNPDALGEILDVGWTLKKGLSQNISTPEIDQWYQIAKKSGAIGGKLLGAGAGGFLLFYAPEATHDALERALYGLRKVPFDFETMGSQILFLDNSNLLGG